MCKAKGAKLLDIHLIRQKDMQQQQITRRALGREHVRPPTKVIGQLSEENHFKTTARSENHATGANTCTWDFLHVKFRVAALIRYRRKQSGFGIRTIIRIGLKS